MLSHMTTCGKSFPGRTAAPGVGAKYDLTNNMALRVEYERINNVGDKNKVGESDVDMWSLGLVVRF